MKSSKRRNPLIHHKPALTWIKKLESTKSATIKKSGTFQSDLPLELNRSLKSFNFSFNYKNQFDLHGNLDLGPHKDELHLLIDEQQYVATRVFLGTHSPPSFTGSISSMHSEGYSDSLALFYRMVIPLQTELKFFFSIEDLVFDTDLGYSSRSGTKCMIAGDELLISVFHDRDKNHFLCIESVVAQSFECFSEKAFATRNALAYITGYYAGDSCYFIAYDKEDMRTPLHLNFRSIRSTMKSHYEPINTNPHSRLYHDPPLADHWYKAECLRPISIQEFSRLGELIYTNQDFASAIILILESSVASLLFMPGGYAIALETIAPLIFEEKKRSLAPITDKGLWKKLRKEILKLIESYKEDHPEHNFQVLKNKINNLNAPTNKSKLKAPFDHLNISLLPEDLLILDTRNDFLHGRAPDLTNEGENRTTERLNSDLYYSALRLSTLLSTLILKWVGYDNYVLNYPKIYEASTGIPLDEDPYRKV